MGVPNPFTPSFGKIPPYMAGRADIIAEMSQAFEGGAGNPNLSTLFVGPRGTGKTALLFNLAREAAARGWVCANVSALPGMLDDVAERTVEASRHLTDEDSGSRLTGFNIGQIVGFEWEPKPSDSGNWRTRMSRILDGLAAQGTGLLITVDEVRPELPEMIQLATVYQQFVAEDRKVALLMAGLPSKISALLRDESVSFLRRSCRYRLGRISDGDIESALRLTVEEAGRTIGEDALLAAVDAIGGFPYMMQLVGFRMWAQHPGEGAISLADARAGIVLAQRDLRERVLEATFYDLSEGDVRMLEAMLQDPRESRLTDLAARLGKGGNYVSAYKKRLIEQGVIGERGRSAVAFELPGFREYLAERMEESLQAGMATSIENCVPEAQLEW